MKPMNETNECMKRFRPVSQRAFIGAWDEVCMPKGGKHRTTSCCRVEAVSTQSSIARLVVLGALGARLEALRV